MRTFKLKIISPEKVFFDGDAQYCGVTTSSGSMGLEAKHVPLIAILKNKTNIQIKDATGSQKSIPIEEGILTFKKNTCSVIVSAK